MTPKETTKASIVVGIDTSRESGLALEWAAHEAARQHVPLRILHADSPGYPATGAAAPDAALRGERTDVLASRAERACADAAATARALHPDLDVTVSRQPLAPGPALVEASRAAGMVVLGARGLGALRSILLGSVSIHVTAHAHCAVVVVREAATRTLPDAMEFLGVDGYSFSTGAIRFAFEQAAVRGRGLTVVHAWQPESVGGTVVPGAGGPDSELLDVQERSLLAESIAGFREEFPTVDVRRHVVQRDPVEELARLSENAHLLVVGTRGRGAMAGLIDGSVSQGVLRRAHCPVAVIHPLTTPRPGAHDHRPERDGGLLRGQPERALSEPG